MTADRAPAFPHLSPDRQPLVDIHAWVIMGNHYHLLVSERSERSLSKFLMRLNVGYAKYFNEKYKRSGTLFQGRTKKIPITRDGHYMHILHYIHLNPLDFSKQTKNWRSGKINGSGQALELLEHYRWSSFLDYCGKKNFPSIITMELFDNERGGYERSLRAYIKELDSGLLHAAELE